MARSRITKSSEKRKNENSSLAVRKDVDRDPPIIHDSVPEDMRKFVMNVWRTRVTKGWTQAQLDEKARLGYARTSTIERGLKLDGITRKTIRQLARAFDVSEQWLLYGHSETPIPKRLEEIEGWFAVARRAQEASDVLMPDSVLRLVGKISVPEVIPLTPQLIQKLAQVLVDVIPHQVGLDAGSDNHRSFETDHTGHKAAV